MPLSPTFSFAIPSLHDGLPLDCRIFHPPSATPRPSGPPLPGHAPPLSLPIAIIAHPYAPLGGNYDDPIVCAAVREARDRGCVVGTFNFRGAPSSKGRSSWTGRAECDDYVSAASCLAHYAYFILQLARAAGVGCEDGALAAGVADMSLDGSAASSIPLPTQAVLPEGTIPLPAPSPDNPDTVPFILAGYSYGSLITTHLPTPAAIFTRAYGPASGPALRRVAWDLAVVSAARGHTGRAIPNAASFRPPPRPVYTSSHNTAELAVTQIGLVFQPAYLLLSPLLAPVSTFTAIPFGTQALQREKGALAKQLAEHPSLAVFGGEDGFTAARKVRAWAAGIEGPGSRFKAVEVPGAGHFWRENGVLGVLRGVVGGWIAGVLQGETVLEVRGAGGREGNGGVMDGLGDRMQVAEALVTMSGVESTAPGRCPSRDGAGPCTELHSG
ncbi:hypothetical protein EJ06DRAFT_579958 [Trichodelitschia bisporula]|uniref:AB hydrolase-1 domain-containing protein n=1 Tax=Trichodelitschia bisporula TaxID=703511 RepID=A0A6G1I3X7_9PEZI|nr:hypothetical protein EJ06DRAFT_579958 [Trichodelitschia bisporula]